LVENKRLSKKAGASIPKVANPAYRIVLKRGEYVIRMLGVTFLSERVATALRPAQYMTVAADNIGVEVLAAVQNSLLLEVS